MGTHALTDTFDNIVILSYLFSCISQTCRWNVFEKMRLIVSFILELVWISVTFECLPFQEHVPNRRLSHPRLRSMLVKTSQFTASRGSLIWNDEFDSLNVIYTKIINVNKVITSRKHSITHGHR